jgi:hypothetical protein
MVSPLLAAVIQYVKAASIIVAFAAAMVILVEGSASDNVPSDAAVRE